MRSTNCHLFPVRSEKSYVDVYDMEFHSCLASLPVSAFPPTTIHAIPNLQQQYLKPFAYDAHTGPEHP